MSDDDLEKLFEGPLYATRIRQELNRIMENPPSKSSSSPESSGN
jgi:hypothetical protein